MRAHIQLLAMFVLWLGAPCLVEARQPTRGEMERVQQLALQLEMDTDEAYVEAVRAANAGDDDEEEALRRLYSLSESASYFREQVDVSYEAPAHTVIAFERVNNDFIDARARSTRLRAYRDHRELFETIEDLVGNLRFYYVDPADYENYSDYELYPYYPGFHLFVHVYSTDVAFHFRHPFYWHLHPEYYKRFPHRVNYRYGYGSYDQHYRGAVKRPWHRDHDRRAPAGRSKHDR